MSASFRVRTDVTVSSLPEGDAVVSTATGANAVILNGTAYVIVELLSQTMTLDEITAIICDSFPGQEQASVETDVAALVRQLVEAGIVEPCGDATSTA